MQEVEIGILNRETKEIFTAMSEKLNQEYMSIGMGLSGDTDEIIIYAFQSNAELFRLKFTATDATISREFLKRYKILKPGAVVRLRKNGTIS